MKLFLLEAIEFSGYDNYQGFVVRAENEEEARKLALQEADSWDKDLWILADKSTCVEILTDGTAGIILSDFVNG